MGLKGTETEMVVAISVANTNGKWKVSLGDVMKAHPS